MTLPHYLNITATMHTKLILWVLACLLSFSTVNAQSCNRKNDSLALVALYNSTNGANWTNKWDLSKPMDTWYGIELSSSGCVLFIRLSYNNLIGMIQHLNLIGLLYLDLRFNMLSGNIPNFNTPNLENLYLANNQLSGNIPNFNLPNLQYIELSLNQLSGNIPNFNSPKLKHIALSLNKLSGNIPNFNLPKLEYIELGENKLSGNIPNFNLENLGTLYLANNQLSGSIPNFNLPNLVSLTLYSNQLSGNIPNFNLPKLEYLNLSSNKLSGDIPNFNAINGLKGLHLQENSLSNCFSTQLNKFCILKFSTVVNGYGYNFTNNPQLPFQGDFSKFCAGESQTGAPCDDSDASTTNDKIQTDCSCKGTKIVVNTCRQTDSLELVKLYNAADGKNWTMPWDLTKSMETWQGVTLSSEKCVTRINLYNRKLKGTALPSLNLPNLQFFDLGGNQLSGVIPDFKLPNLQELYLYLNQFSGEIPNFNFLPKLETLAIWSNPTLKGVVPNCSKMPNLKGIDLYACSLTGTIPNFNLPKLEILSIDNNQLTGNIPNFNLPQLKLLHLYYNKLDGAIPNLNLPNLEDLGVQGNKLSGNIPTFNNLPKIKRLYLHDNNLSGCFPSELKRFCSLGFNNIDYQKDGYNFTKNPALAWSGEFSKFCAGESQTGAVCDDSDITTTNDKIQLDCTCKGTKIVANTCRKNDSLALVAVFRALKGQNWLADYRWDFKKPMDTWKGVQLTNDCVTCIDLDGDTILCNQWLDNPKGVGLVGSLPDSISLLSNLKVLYLRGNKGLTGTFPTNIGNLKQLQYLFADECGLKGDFPASFWNMSGLEVLNLNKNPLNIAFPKQISNLKKLRSIELSTTAMSGTMPTEIGLLDSLRNFAIDDNRLEGIFPNIITNCKHLQLLNIHKNQFTSFPNIAGISFKKENEYWSNYINIFENKLTFKDILPNITFVSRNLITYAPQDSFYTTTTITKKVSESFTIDLGIDAGITTNVYTWFKDGKAYKTINGSNKLTFADLQSSDAGSYQVQVTNPTAPLLTLYGRAVTINISCAASTVATITGNTSICTGQNTTLTAPTNALTYAWSTGASTNSISIKPTNNTTYTVTTTDNNGCKSIGTKIVSIVPLPTATISGSAISVCAGSSTTLQATGGTSYQWSTNQTTATITPSSTQSSIYTVTVTDANGCTASASKSIAIKPLPTTNITGKTTICTGESTTLTANNSDNYQWSNGTLGNKTTVSPKQNTIYTVLVKDANGCTGMASQSVQVVAAPTAAIIVPQKSVCKGMTISLKATGGTTYTWADGQTNATVNVTPIKPTTYIVTVTDNNGCNSIVSQLVVAYEPPKVIATPDPANCGQANGTVLLSISGGVQPYQFAWSTGSTSAYIDNVSAGNYTVTLTDASGCTTTAASTVTTTQSANIIAKTTETTTCTKSDGTVVLTIVGGTPPYNYLWNNGNTTKDLSNIAAGSYIVSVTDGKQCLSTKNITIPSFSKPILQVATKIAVCKGTIVVEASGSSPFSYLWSNGAKTKNLIDVATGAYSVTVTDKNKCTESKNVELLVPRSLSVRIDTLNPSDCSKSDGSIDVSPQGTAPYTYQWSQNTPKNKNLLDNLPAGNYKVTVTDDAGCKSSHSITLKSCDKKITILTKAFAPNRGELLFIGLSDGTDAQDYPNNELIIYDQKRQTVYHEFFYQNNWDGGNLPEADYDILFIKDIKNPALKMRAYDHVRGGFTLLRR